MKHHIGNEQVDALGQRVALPNGAWLIFALDHLGFGLLKDRMQNEKRIAVVIQKQNSPGFAGWRF